MTTFENTYKNENTFQHFMGDVSDMSIKLNKYLKKTLDVYTYVKKCLNWTLILTILYALKC